MRSIWQGTLGLGSVTMRVRLYSATVDPPSKVKLRPLHRDDKGVVRYEHRCRSCGERVVHDKSVKAFEASPGELVTIEDAELESIDPAISRHIGILGFSDEAIEPGRVRRSYVVEPEEGSERAYVLLRETLREAGAAGVAKIVLHHREQLAALRQKDDALVLDTLRTRAELRDPGELALPEAMELEERERDLARTLVQRMRASFSAGEVPHDDYADAFEEIVRAKLEGRPVVPVQRPAVAISHDLPSLLEKSVQALGREEARKPAKRVGKKKRAA